MDTIIQLISTVGFPIAVAEWFMVVDHKDSQNNTEAINKMANALDNNTRIIEKLYDK